MSDGTVVKVCGVTRPQDALAAADAGVDFIGMVFAAGSPRQVSVATATAIATEVRRRHAEVPRLVGVFVDADPDAVIATRRMVGLDLIQLHGNEPPLVLDLLGERAIRAIRVGGSIPDTAMWNRAGWLLFDTYSERARGGTGESFDWSLLAGRSGGGQPFLVAGGLNPGNVRRAMDAACPDGVDVSSGVEAAPGIKDAELIRRFVREVRRA